MFKFLKEKLKKAVDKFSKDVDEEAKTEEIEEEIVVEEVPIPEEKPVKEEPAEEKPKEEIKETPIPKEEPEIKEDIIEKVEPVPETIIVSEDIDEEKILKELEKEKEVAEEERRPKALKAIAEEPVEEIKEVIEEKKEEPSTQALAGYDDDEKKSGFFSKIKEKIITKTLSVEKFNDLFFDLEITLLENNVAIEVIEKIKADLRREMVNKPIKRNAIEETIIKTLRSSIEELFDIKGFDLLEKIKDKKPTIISFVGINGSGKTTTIAKIATLLKKNGMKCVLAAGDTFRAASIEQLQEHADNIDIKLIKHTYGSDPAAVAYDAINYAKAKQIDVVLIDTAGRLHNNKNLMDEIKKINRVANPDLNIFIGESITGNDCIEQAKVFNDAIGIHGIILSKADIDEKGGASISVSYVTKKPILYLGIGQEYDDIKKFDSEDIIKKLGI